MKAQLGDSQAYDAVQAWAEAKLGFHFDDTQRVAVRKRLQGLMDRLRIPDPSQLLAKLKSDEGNIRSQVAEALATHHTGFFREPQVLEHIRSTVAPDLNAKPGTAKVWSAACSYGHEPYSVAIILSELMGIDEARQKYSILATDLVRSVVDKAELGQYSASQLGDVSSQRRLCWFESAGDDRLRVRKELRKMIAFRSLNLMSEPWPFKSRFSLILCRNVLYYFDKPVQRRVVSRLYDQLEPGGWLITSVSENIAELGTRFRPAGSGLYRRAS